MEEATFADGTPVPDWWYCKDCGRNAISCECHEYEED